MEYNDVKLIFKRCPDLSDLDEAVLGSLCWRGDEKIFTRGTAIYAEDASLDDTFCLLLSGELLVEKGGLGVGEIAGHQIFGEMAYFTRLQKRTATVRVASPEASVLQMRLTPADLATKPFSSLKRHLGLQAWDRFVSSSQS